MAFTGREAAPLAAAMVGAISSTTWAQPAPLCRQVVRLVGGDTVVLQDAYGTLLILRLRARAGPKCLMPIPPRLRSHRFM